MLGTDHFYITGLRRVTTFRSITDHVYEVCPKSNEDYLKKVFLLNIHVITVYFLQNKLLVIEYSDSSVAATLRCSGGSLHLR